MRPRQLRRTSGYTHTTAVGRPKWKRLPSGESITKQRKQVRYDRTCCLRFASQGKSPQVVVPRPGAPFPEPAVEEAWGSAEVGAFPPTLGLAGSVCPLGTQPSLYFSPPLGLIPALTKAQSLVPRQAHSPCRSNRWVRWFPRLFKVNQQLKHKTCRSQGQAGSPASQQP